MFKNMHPFMVLAVIIALVLVIIFAPYIMIWTINTLFTLSIPYTFKYWLAAFMLLVMIGR